MLEIRDLQFLSALARHKHFAKAAQECGVSQPAFSMRIRALEERLDTTIVKRGNRFQGLTAEGEAILRHARRILDDMRFLEQEVLAAKGEISGTLVMGVIPTASAYAARIAIHLYGLYPKIVARIETASSLEIQQRIEDGTIDAGLTYGDDVSGDMVSVRHVYDERYALLAPVAMVEKGKTSITWAEAAELPLSLLEPKMQNRRILDRMFEEVGARPRIVSESNVMMTSMIMAREGLAAAVVPVVVLEAMGPFKGTVSLPLTDPDLGKSICLLTAARMPGLPTVEALRRALDTFPS